MLFVIKCVVITLELCSVYLILQCYPGDRIDVSIVFKPKWTDTRWNVCELIAIILAHYYCSAEWAGALPARRADPWPCFAQVCLVRSCSVCVSSLPLSPFPYCSALYDNVVVNRVYSELALGWTSKPPWTLMFTGIYQSRSSSRVV